MTKEQVDKRRLAAEGWCCKCAAAGANPRHTLAYDKDATCPVHGVRLTWSVIDGHNATTLLYCPKCNAGFQVFSLETRECPECGQSDVELREYVERLMIERYVYIGIWILVFVLSSTIGPQNEEGIGGWFRFTVIYSSVVIVCSYIIGCFAFHIIKTSEYIPVEEARSSPEFFRFTWSRLRTEFIYSLSVVGVVGLLYLAAMSYNRSLSH